MPGKETQDVAAVIFHRIQEVFAVTLTMAIGGHGGIENPAAERQDVLVHSHKVVDHAVPHCPMGTLGNGGFSFSRLPVYLCMASTDGGG